MSEEKQSVGLKPGDKVLIKGDHPWSTHTGTVERLETIHSIGLLPVVKLDNGMKCFLLKESDFEKL